jgi:hypothetical protein
MWAMQTLGEGFVFGMGFALAYVLIEAVVDTVLGRT